MSMIENPDWTLFDRIRRARLLAGLDQADIARAAGVARATVSTWENGKTEPNASALVRIARATGQPLDWFAEGVHPLGLEPRTHCLIDGTAALGLLLVVALRAVRA